MQIDAGIGNAGIIIFIETCLPDLGSSFSVNKKCREVGVVTGGKTKCINADGYEE